LFTALTSFLHRPQPPTAPAPALFDDGLAEIARLIAADDDAARLDAADAGPVRRSPSAPAASMRSRPSGGR
jgi:hypothetical protein